MRFTASLGILLLAWGTASCASSHPATVVNSPGLGERVPLDPVLERFERAREQDPTLMLGFYTAPWVDDYPSDGTGAEAHDDDGLIARLRREVEPDSWNRPGRDAFRHNEWLVVFQSEAVHERIHPWIEATAARIFEQQSLVSTSLQILQLPKHASGEAGRVAGIELPGAESAVPVDAEGVRRLLDTDGVTIISAPQLALLSGQRGSIVVANETAYVSDYVIYYVNGAKVVDPVVDTVVDGIIAELVTTLDAGTGSVDVEMEVSVSDLAGIADTEVQIGDRTVTLQIPEVSLVQSQARFRQKLGSTMLIDGGRLDGGRALILATTN